METTLLRLCALAIANAMFGPGTQAQAAPDLGRITDPTVWRVQNRHARAMNVGDHKGVRLDAQPDDGVAWLVDSVFCSGTIEIDLRGSNLPNQSFVGIAFHGLDRTTYEAVYFRPFNFRNPDVGRRAHSVQYISQPVFPWEKLRADSPGKYEQPIAPAPEPDGWVHARIVVKGRSVQVFVNAATHPSLEVNSLGGRRDGLVGLWVGNNSSGEFANLTLTPEK